MTGVEAAQVVGVEATQVAGVLSGSTTASASAPFMSLINSFFQTQPYLAAFLTCSVKASAADMLAQSQEDSSEANDPSFNMETQTNGLDISRNLGFLMYGGLYSGLAQNYLYNVVYPKLFGADDGSLQHIIEQVVADNLIFAPLLCLPIAYVFKAAFTSEEVNWEAIAQGLQKYIDDVTNKGLLWKYWSLWIPVQFMTFGVIPAHFRVVFVAAVSFFWICILSTIASSEDEPAIKSTE